MAVSELFLVMEDERNGSLDWQNRAICPQTDPEAFFPEKGGSTREAKKVCAVCDVRTQCLDYALGKDERFGIWGGLSERERRRFKQQQQEGSEDATSEEVQLAITTILESSDFSEDRLTELAAWFQTNLPEWKKFAEELIDSYIATIQLKRRQRTPQRLAAYALGNSISSVSSKLIRSERDNFRAYLEANPDIFETCLKRMSETEEETDSPEVY